MFIKQLLQKLTSPKEVSSKTLEPFPPLVVGIDPQLSLIHPSLFTGPFSKIVEWSNPTRPKHSLDNEHNLLGIIAELYSHYAKVVIDAVHDLVPTIKIQVAFFEPYGQYGMVALEEVIRYAHGKGLLVIADAKRGDISSTAEAYAKTFLGNLSNSKDIISTPSPLSSDALTVNPYMGADSLEPFFLRTRMEEIKKFNRADDTDDAYKSKGIFVLLKTSNPGSIDIQDQELKDGSKVYELVIKMIKAEIDSHHSYAQHSNSASNNYANVGVVVGATFPEEAKRIRMLLPHSYFLVPGLGFQQGSFSGLRNYLNPDGKGALFNVSRGIIYPHLLKEIPDGFTIRSSYNWKQLGEDVRSLTKHYTDKIKVAIE